MPYFTFQPFQVIHFWWNPVNNKKLQLIKCDEHLQLWYFIQQFSCKNFRAYNAIQRGWHNMTKNRYIIQKLLVYNITPYTNISCTRVVVRSSRFPFTEERTITLHVRYCVLSFSINIHRIWLCLWTPITPKIIKTNFRWYGYVHAHNKSGQSTF